MAASARQPAAVSPQHASARLGDDELAARLRLVVMRLGRRLRQQAGDDLSPTLISALVTIERHGPLTLGRLAALERVKRPSVTRIVAGLEKRGLVACEVDSTDRRVRVVAVTATARRLLRDSRTRKTAYLARHLRELPGGDIDALAAAVGVLERLLEGDE
jgi:DNA-binding MarR family transcriptional regulator